MELNQLPEITLETSNGTVVLQTRDELKNALAMLDLTGEQYIVLSAESGEFYQAGGNRGDGFEIEHRLPPASTPTVIDHADSSSRLAELFLGYFDKLSLGEGLQTSGRKPKRRGNARSPRDTRLVERVLNGSFIVLVLVTIVILFVNRGSHNPRIFPFAFLFASVGALLLTTSGVVGRELSMKSGPNITADENPFQFWLSIVLAYIAAITFCLACLWGIFR